MKDFNRIIDDFSKTKSEFLKGAPKLPSKKFNKETLTILLSKVFKK